MNASNFNKDQCLFKEVHMNDKSICATRVEFNEITKYHLMKNKFYIITEDTKKKVTIYNIMKLSKVYEYSNTKIEDVINIFENYDKFKLKQWFTVDIKLGTLSITFLKDSCFSNPLNFDTEYLEKILQKVNLVQNPDNKTKVSEWAETLNKFYLDNRILENSKFSQTSFKKSLSEQEKIASNGYSFLRQILHNFLFGKEKSQREAIYKNFEDKEGSTLSLKIKENEIKEKNNSVGSVPFIKIVPNYFLFTYMGDRISVAPFVNEINSTFTLPGFLNEIFISVFLSK